MRCISNLIIGSAAICIQYIGAIENEIGIIVSSTSDIVDTYYSDLYASKRAYSNKKKIFTTDNITNFGVGPYRLLRFSFDLKKVVKSIEEMLEIVFGYFVGLLYISSLFLPSSAIFIETFTSFEYLDVIISTNMNQLCQQRADPIL